MIKLIVLGAVVLVAVVAFKLFKAKQAVTVASVVAGAETVVKSAAVDIEKKV